MRHGRAPHEPRSSACLRLFITLVSITACGGGADPPRLVFGTTHTLEDSGVLGVLTSAWIEDHGTDHRLSVVVAGTGEILAMAERGDIDAALVHSPDDEIAFVESGRAESRQPVMHNDFVLLGPPADPAGVDTIVTTAGALRRIAMTGQPFVSRGDDSGTHSKERQLWTEAQLIPDWSGYVEAGTGMADALRLASQRGAYILADRATFAVLRSSLQLEIMHEGDPVLHNQYSVIVVADANNAVGARQLAEWLRGETAQRLIRTYRAPGMRRALFTPDAIQPVGSAHD